MSEQKHITGGGKSSAEYHEIPPPGSDFDSEYGDDNGAEDESSRSFDTQASSGNTISDRYLPAHRNGRSQTGLAKPRDGARVSSVYNADANHIYPTTEEQRAPADSYSTPTERCGNTPPSAYEPGHVSPRDLMILELEKDLREAGDRGDEQKYITIARDLTRHKEDFREMEMLLGKLEREEMKVGKRVIEYAPFNFRS